MESKMRKSKPENQVQKIIATLGMSDEQIAVKLEVAGQTVYRWRKGICAPRRTYVTLLRELLKKHTAAAAA